jgi:hypothetical protein
MGGGSLSFPGEISPNRRKKNLNEKLSYFAGEILPGVNQKQVNIGGFVCMFGFQVYSHEYKRFIKDFYSTSGL